MARMKLEDLRRLLERVNRICGGYYVYDLDRGNGRQRLVRRRATESSGTIERSISPILTVSALYDWIQAFLDGFEAGQDKSSRLHQPVSNALNVLVRTEAISAWLKVNDPKALSQAETALSGFPPE